jgi:hypothetical protein
MEPTDQNQQEEKLLDALARLLILIAKQQASKSAE